MLKPPLLLTLAILFVADLTAQIDQEMLDAVKAEVVPVVEKATGVDMGHITIRFDEPGELAKLLSFELEAQAKATKMSKAQARVLSRAMSKTLFGKFSWNTDEILICPRNFKWQAKILENPELNDPGVLRAVLVHECIHAVDEHRFAWSKVIRSLTSADQLQAYNAVIEGHAQHQTARICKAQGWSKGFEIFTSNIGRLPPSTDAASRLLSEVAAANQSAAYHDGRRFVAFLEKKLGDKGLARAFKQPAADFESVLNPAWYLDSSTRPVKLYEFQPALDGFSKKFEKDEWADRFLTLSTPQIKASMALIKGPDLDRLLGHLKHNRVVLLLDKKQPNHRQITAGLFELDSPAEARFYALANTNLMKAKDLAMKSGRVQILSADYTRLDSPELRGYLAVKKISVAGSMIVVSTLVAAQGSVGIELSFVNEMISPEAIEAHARELLAATRKADPEVPAIKKPTQTKSKTGK